MNKTQHNGGPRWGGHGALKTGEKASPAGRDGEGVDGRWATTGRWCPNPVAQDEDLGLEPKATGEPRMV